MNQALPFSPQPATSPDGRRPQTSAGDAERQLEPRATRGAHAEAPVVGAGEAGDGKGRRRAAMRTSGSTTMRSRDVPQRTWPQVDS